jgi:hypothetical protein
MTGAGVRRAPAPPKSFGNLDFLSCKTHRGAMVSKKPILNIILDNPTTGLDIAIFILGCVILVVLGVR